MTILAAAMDEKEIWVGCDGLASDFNFVRTHDEFKWRISPDGRWARGSLGERAFDGALAGAEWPEEDGEAGLLKLMAAWRRALDATPSFRRQEPESQTDDYFSDYGFCPIVVSVASRKIWRVHSTLFAFDGAIEGAFQVAGTGEFFSLGALQALWWAGERSAEKLVRAAIRVGCRWSTTCGGTESYMRLSGQGIDC